MPEPSNRSTETGARRVGRIALGILLCAVCVAGIWLSASYAASRLLSRYASVSGDVVVAKQAVALTPGDPDARTLLGMMLAQQRNYRDAVTELETATQLRPHDYYPWLELGMARDQTGDQTGAERALRESARLAPQYAQPAWQLGNVLFRLGRTDEAFTELRRAVRSDTTLLPAVIELAGAADPNPAAIREKLKPQTPLEHILLARFFAKHGKGGEARVESRLSGGAARDHTHSLIKELIAQGFFSEAREIWSNEYGAGKGNTNANGSLMHDGGFESTMEVDDPGFGWQFTQGLPAIALSLDPNNPFADAKSLRIDYRGVSYPGVSAVSQLVVVDPKTQYRLQLATHVQDVVSGGLPVVVITDARPPNVTLLESPALGSGTDKWHESTHDFTTGELTRGVRINVRRKACTSDPCPIFGSLWLDAFSLRRH